MLESAKVVAAMVNMELTGRGKRKEYGYGNKNHSVRESREVIYGLMQQLTTGMLKGAATEIKIKGKENLPKQGPVLYVATHKSIFDIVLLTNMIDDPCIFIGKKEVRSEERRVGKE